MLFKHKVMCPYHDISTCPTFHETLLQNEIWLLISKCRILSIFNLLANTKLELLVAKFFILNCCFSTKLCDSFFIITSFLLSQNFYLITKKF